MQGVLGAFQELDTTVSVINELKKKRLGDVTVYSPTIRHEIEHAIDAPVSVVRRFTLVGGLLGVSFGYWIAIWSSTYWPLVTGGKAIASWIPYTIIGFEVFVLVGALSTVAGMFINSRIPRLASTTGYDARFSSGHFGVFIACSPTRPSRPRKCCVVTGRRRCVVKTERTSAYRTPMTRALRLLVVVVLPFAFGACEWFTDFKRQPAIEPWEPMSQSVNDTTHSPRGEPRFSVPLTGVEVPGYGISYGQLPATIDSFTTLVNPVAVDARSLDNGRKQFQINCAVCHGTNGSGISKMNKYGFAIGLSSGPALTRTDGYIFGMIRNGRGAMPSYNRIEQMDRWDIVNYVRELQGKTSFPIDSSSVGYAGENGTMVPGPSQTAPTRPAPFLKPSVTPTKGSGGFNSATYPPVGGESRKPADSKEKPE